MKGFLKDNKKLVVALVVLFSLWAIISIRIVAWTTMYPDFNFFLDPWLKALRENGPAIVGTDFANYHPPYLYMMWLFSLFIPSNLDVIKTIGLLGDIILAFAVYKLIAEIRTKGIYKYIAGVGTLLLPTVVFNSAFWGQCDAIYSAFLVFAVYYGIRRNLTWMWAMIAVAIAFKTQGIFLIPFALYVSAIERKWLKGILAAGGTLAVLLGLPLLFGIPVADLVKYYVRDFQPMWGYLRLSWWCPNLMSWFPNAQYDFWRTVGLILYGAELLLFLKFGFVWKKWGGKDQLLKMAALSCTIATFVLPQLHGRYYFPAEILLFALAFTDRLWIITAALMQAVTMVALLTYFNNETYIDMMPYRVLSIPVFIIIIMLVTNIYKARAIIRKVDESKD